MHGPYHPGGSYHSGFPYDLSIQISVLFYRWLKFLCENLSQKLICINLMSSGEQLNKIT